MPQQEVTDPGVLLVCGIVVMMETGGRKFRGPASEASKHTKAQRKDYSTLSVLFAHTLAINHSNQMGGGERMKMREELSATRPMKRWQRMSSGKTSGVSGRTASVGPLSSTRVDHSNSGDGVEEIP